LSTGGSHGPRYCGLVADYLPEVGRKNCPRLRALGK
jgi:hypothetical protein